MTGMNRRRFLGTTIAAAALTTANLPSRLPGQEAAATPPPPSPPRAPMLDLPISDGHVHLWDPALLDYAWIKRTPIAGPHLPADLWCAAGGLKLRQAVFIQAECRRDQAAQEVAWVETLAATVEKRLAGIVAFAPLEEGARIEPTLAALAARPLLKGVRRLIQGEHAPGFALRPDFVAGVRLLAKHDLSFDVGARADQLPDVLGLARACPDVSFVLNHLGQPPIRERRLQPWADDLARLAAAPNVWCKVSGAVTLAGAGWQAADLRPAIEHVIDCFGWDRVLFGSDWPTCDLAGNYQRWVAALAEIVSGASDDQRERLFARNAQRCYRLPMNPPTA